MKSYIPVTFAFLGLAFYQLSGGTDFRPQEQAALAPTEAAQAEELVTRADSELTLANLTTLPVIAPIADTQAADVANAVAAAAAAPLADPEPQIETVATVEPTLDLRAVNGELVNMREGPGTDFGVVAKLSRGTQVQVLETGADGWLRLKVVDTGAEGWMAARLLVNIDT